MNERYAFPGPNWTVNPRGETEADQPGMTLRDYFAAKAMQSFCTKASQWENSEALSRDAYAMADAMLAARDTETTER